MNLARRFIHFSTIGVLAFLIDLAILSFLTEIANVPYLASAAISFVCATTMQYTLVRKQAFKETKNKHQKSYSSFMAIALLNLLIILATLWIAVELLHLNYLLARIVIAGLVGIWNFIATAKFAFDVELLKI